MIQAMIWKEYREHRAVWLTLAFVNGTALFGLLKLMAPESAIEGTGAHEMLQAVAVLLAWTYGMVCGSILLAGEREAATLTFLDMLPVGRLQLWWVKCLVGLVLFLAQVAVLAVVVVVLGITPTVLQTAGMVLAMLLLGLAGMAWGLLFSSRGENVLNAIGLAIVGQIAAVIAVNFLSLAAVFVWQIGTIWLIGQQSGGPISDRIMFGVLPCLAGGGLTLAAVAGSARIFSRPDRLRGRRQTRLAAVQRRPKRNIWASWGRLLWLSYIQMRRLVLGMMLFALGLGFLLPAAGGLVVWPLFTLVIGVVCGVTVFGDEQLHGSFRFLGDQRFPLGRVWIVKVAMRFALAVFAASLLLLPSLIFTIIYRIQADSPPESFFAQVLHSGVIGPVAPTGICLAMWLLYGFTVGHLCGLLFRKSLVAGVVSLGWSALLVSLWVPSLLGMGLHFWQVAGVPLILLVAAWLLMPAWAADRLVARGTFLRLGAALAAAGLWTAGGLWYRVAEVPDVPDHFDMPAFLARIPSMDDDKAGRAINSAWSHVEALTGFPDAFTDGQISEVLERGWPKEQIVLGHYLDKHFQNEEAKNCLELLSTAADHPVGMVANIKNLNFRDSFLSKWDNALLLNRILAVRGLQLQAQGDPQTFVDYLRIGLAISRNLQNFAPPRTAFQGRRAEGVWPAAIDLWLEHLQGSPEAAAMQLERVAAILRQHEKELPDEADLVKAAYLLAANTLEQVPAQLLEEVGPDRPREEQEALLHRMEADTVSLMWRIPWEQERHRRILRATFEGDQQQLRQARECGLLIAVGLGIRLDRAPRSKRDLAQLRASQLKAALRWYQAKTGKLPRTLDALVPHYLSAIPADPFDNKPFRYRLSGGEEVGWIDVEQAPPAPVAPPPPLGIPGAPGGMPGAGGEMPAEAPGMFGVPQPPKRAIPAGQGILWVVGEDGHDDGGVKQGKDTGTMFGEDILFLIPPPRE